MTTTLEALQAFDEAVSAELPRVSHLEYDSHEICKHFAGKVRERFAALSSPAPQGEVPSAEPKPAGEARIRVALQEFVDALDEKSSANENMMQSVETAERSFKASERIWDNLEPARAALAHPTAQQAAEPEREQAWPNVSDAIEEYVQSYELRGDSGDYTPSERERFLITDAVHGILDDDDCVAAIRAALRVTTHPAAPGNAERVERAAERAVFEGLTKDPGMNPHLIPSEKLRQALVQLRAALRSPADGGEG